MLPLWIASPSFDMFSKRLGVFRLESVRRASPGVFNGVKVVKRVYLSGLFLTISVFILFLIDGLGNASKADGPKADGYISLLLPSA